MPIILKTFDFLLNPLVRYLMSKKQIRRKIANNVFISSEWIEIEVKPPMKVKKNFQAVLLHIEGCWTSLFSKEKGVKLSNGTVITPKVEMIDEYGNKYFLKSGMSFGMPDDNCEKMILSEIGFRKNLPNDRKYTAVRIFSDQPFLCKSISLYDYNLK